MSQLQAKPASIKIFIMPVVLATILVVLLLSIYDGIKPVKPLKPLDTFENVHILDNASAFKCKDEVEPQLKSFEKATGICPYIITVKDSDWENTYESLDSYASKLYKDKFSDQQHFLIVCSVYEDNPATVGFYSTKSGTDANKILKGDLIDGFRDNFNQFLYKDHILIDDAVIKTFDDLVYCTGPFMYIDFVEVFFTIILIPITIIFFLKAIQLYTDRKRQYMYALKHEHQMIDEMK